jgi:hypothetical protein
MSDTLTTFHDRPSTWRRVLVIGSVALLVAVGSAIVLVERNWSTLTSLYHQATATFSELLHVAAALQAKYGGTASVMAKHESRVEGTTLSITLVNPSFLDALDPDGPRGKEQALEVAVTARNALPSQSAYEHYEIILVRERGVGITVSRTWMFRFDASDLQAAGATPQHAAEAGKLQE